ncbi:MAG: flagellar motor switch protein FliM [Chloroflexi bacterium]|nr:flagellar motor switch protein FliM [Chloroflexota bacterium]
MQGKRENKILSQAEIEALLAGEGLAPVEEPPAALPSAGSAPGASGAATAVAAPPAPPSSSKKPAKLYDFRRPDKFSKEHLRALRILHESFARILASSLTSYLSAGVQVKLTMLEQGTYDEYIDSLPTPTVIYVVGLSPLPGQAVVELNLPVATVLIDRLLGGPGAPSERTGDLTEIELALLKTIGQFILSSLREAWANVAPLRPTMQEPVMSPELAQFATMAEATVMLVLEVALLRTTGTISMCIPYQVLQPVLENLTSQVWMGGSRTESDDSDLDLSEQMGQVTLPISVELGTAELSVHSLLGLSEGQVIRLNTNANGSLVVRVDDQTKFLGQPGLSGKNLAVQIVRTIA